MSALHQQPLQPCHSQCVALSIDEVSQLLQQIHGWRTENIQGVLQLVKSFKFKNFSDALVFANKVAELAEEVDHHPCICIEWGKVTINWWTHNVSGLFINDFILAAKCDEAYSILE